MKHSSFHVYRIRKMDIIKRLTVTKKSLLIKWRALICYNKLSANIVKMFISTVFIRMSTHLVHVYVRMSTVFWYKCISHPIIWNPYTIMKYSFHHRNNWVNVNSTVCHERNLVRKSTNWQSWISTLNFQSWKIHY